MQNASSAERAWMANLSASLNTVTVGMPSLRALAMTRQAISPRFAINSLLMGMGLSSVSALTSTVALSCDVGEL
jgi:hypothetical protein